MLPMLLAFVIVTAASAQRLDLAAFARPCCAQDEHRLQTTFDYGHPRGVVEAADRRWIYGLQWAEERDLFEVAVRFRRPYDAALAALQYWHLNWPPPPPRMPTIEDPVDDPWQGAWRTARTELACEGLRCRFTFQPLEAAENPRASNLPGLRHRRALRMRLVFPAGQRPEFETVEVFSETALRRVELRVTVPGAPAFRAYNGHVRGVRRIEGSALLAVDMAEPRPAGSHDVTVIEVRDGARSFTFAPADLERGPIWIPHYQALITRAGEAVPSAEAIVRRGARIRERLQIEPEQTYERAAREIPALDPIERQGGPLYLPLAADASWQKFALQWGGHAYISKGGTKAMGRELARLPWVGDRLGWYIGTGEKREFRWRSEDSTLALLEDHLPVAVARWSSDGLEYEQESFATLLSGPLAPDDPARSEQTPAVLLMKIRAANPGAVQRTAHLWLQVEPVDLMSLERGLLLAGEDRWVRAAVHLPPGASARCEPNLHIAAPVAAGGDAAIVLALPFIPGLTETERGQLAALDYAAERRRVLEYWRGVIARGAPFRVPEERFNRFARGLIARIRMSVTKDPASGIYMVPAASYIYRVYANEAVFQAQLLDLLGQHELARRFYQAQVELQGSKPFLGSYTGDQKAVYHGARVSAEYDYTASQYNLDHGAVLTSLAEHYFITRDRAWLARVAPGMKRAADWIIEQRRLTQVRVDGGPCPEYGLLPGGHLEDNRDWGHWFSVNAYASAGLSALARALGDAGDPDAARYAKEAAAYRTELRAAVERATAAAPVIRLRDNTYVPYVPTRAHQRIRLFGPLRVGFYSRYPEKVLPTYRLSATRELLYGPLILVESGIFDAREPLADWVLDDWEDNLTMSEPLGLHVHGMVDEDLWFSRGGMVFQANLQNPVRTYIRRGEARAAIRGQYNAFVSCHYPAVNVFTEEYRQWRSPSGPFYKTPDEARFVLRLRDMLVAEDGDDLLLAAGTPARWLEAGRRISVESAPTHFGPVSFDLEAYAGEVRGVIRLPVRNPYRDAWLNVRLPEGRRVVAVTLDGKEWRDADLARGRIHLPRSRAPVRVVVKTAPPR